MAKSSNKIRINLRAYEHNVLDAAAVRIVEVAKKTGAKVVGPVPLPTQREVFTMLI